MAAPDTIISSDALLIGSSLQEGNFCIETVIAVSAFGITYLARDTVLNRPVVIKEFFPEGCRREAGKVVPHRLHDSQEQQFVKVRERFLGEARALARFHHPGIVGVYTFFEANNTAYMVMEYLQGKTLQEMLDERGASPPDEVIGIARQLGAALNVVHDAGMLHRDIKPSNIIRCDDGRVVLVDFGLSETFDAGDSRQTRPLDSALRFGTPGYAPLEQYTHSAQLGPTADIYALGATLYHLCSGQLPIPATDRACGVALPKPQCAQPVLVEYILWAMQTQPQKRPPSVAKFLQRVEQADALYATRIQMLQILQARGTQLAHQPKSTLTEPAEPVDDTGCMKIAFILYVGIWGIAATVWFIFLFVRYVLVGH